MIAAPTVDPAAQALLARYTRELAPSNRWTGSWQAIAGGAAHQSWRADPFPVVFERARGVYKWDVANREYIDFWMGHGSLLLGNAHPAVVEAVCRQMRDGQHIGGAHRLHYEWAERIRAHFPVCEKIRFTASGTEATLLALRIARAVTGRGRVIRIDGHFHGWHDDALVHIAPADTCGFNPGTAEFVSVVPPLDVGAVQEELEEGDIAALILEPGGGSSGCLPWSPEYLQQLRNITAQHGTLLVFDEVISGFRYFPGGVGALAQVAPDLVTLAKISCGGMPGGMVGGRATTMAAFGSEATESEQPVRVIHSGTFNGFPLTAAAAIATIDLVGDGHAGRLAEHQTQRLVEGINRAARATNVDIGAFCQSSIFHLVIGAHKAGVELAPGASCLQLTHAQPALYRLLRMALQLEGIDGHASHGWVSFLHDKAILDEAMNRFQRAFATLREIEAFACPASARTTQQTSCQSECHDALCGSRMRTIAACSLPLAGVAIKSIPQRNH